VSRGLRRVDYDAIAHLYDAQPYRERTADPELAAFVERRKPGDPLAILDIGCGTGNQLAANRIIAPEARLVGLDRSLGMLRQAQPKAPQIAWVQADGAMLPFRLGSFDFLSCQFAFHHLRDKPGMLRDGYRVLRVGGRLVIRNLCPQECPDWLCYEYFPEARDIDLADFWAPDATSSAMQEAGFAALTVGREHLHFEQDLHLWLDIVRRRDICSQLLAISDRAYRAGIRRLERDLAREKTPRARADHLCLVTFRGDKPGMSAEDHLAQRQ
jgi:SAM-dependent methyltransferase